MNKPYVTVTLTLHNGTTKEIADYVDNSGRFVALGTQALAMLNRHDAIHYVDAEGVETFIPYHAIVAVDIAKESDEYTKPEDDFCKAEGGETLGRKISFDLTNVCTGVNFTNFLYYINGLAHDSTLKFDHDGTLETVTGAEAISDNTLELSTENGTYVLTLGTDAETGNHYFAVDDEHVDSLDFYTDNDKKYVMYLEYDMSSEPTYSFSGFFNEGEEPVVEKNFGSLVSRIYKCESDDYGCCQANITDHKLPAVTDDAFYYIYVEG